MKTLTNETESNKLLPRRSFLKYAGTGAVATALLAYGCDKNDIPTPDQDGEYFGSGDIAILNYAYALEQLEAAFYTKVADSPYSGINSDETALLTDIRDHEIAHREFFKQALGNKAIGSLEVNFSGINFGNRTSVLETARTFEDLGVSAYNGAGWLIQDGNYLLLAGKIVSVEARHAALIRDLISNGSFADNTIIDNMGMDMHRSPTEVLALAGPFIKTKINTSDLPTY